jgi:hypothetical protein
VVHEAIIGSEVVKYFDQKALTRHNPSQPRRGTDPVTPEQPLLGAKPTVILAFSSIVIWEPKLLLSHVQLAI